MWTLRSSLGSFAACLLMAGVLLLVVAGPARAALEFTDQAGSHPLIVATDFPTVADIFAEAEVDPDMAWILQRLMSEMGVTSNPQVQITDVGYAQVAAFLLGEEPAGEKGSYLIKVAGADDSGRGVVIVQLDSFALGSTIMTSADVIFGSDSSAYWLFDTRADMDQQWLGYPTIVADGTMQNIFTFGDLVINARFPVSNPDVVPLPGAVVLGFLGLSVAGWKLRRLS